MDFGEDNNNDSDNSGDDLTNPAIVPVDEDLSVSSNKKSPIPQPHYTTSNKVSNKTLAARNKHVTIKRKRPVTKKPLPLKSPPPLSAHKLPPPTKRVSRGKGADASDDDNQEVFLPTIKK